MNTTAEKETFSLFESKNNELINIDFDLTEEEANEELNFFKLQYPNREWVIIPENEL